MAWWRLQSHSGQVRRKAGIRVIHDNPAESGTPAWFARRALLRAAVFDPRDQELWAAQPAIAASVATGVIEEVREDIIAVDSNHRVFSSDSEIGGITIFEGRQPREQSSFIALDPPTHDQQRKVIAPMFAPPSLIVLEPLIREQFGAPLTCSAGEAPEDNSLFCPSMRSGETCTPGASCARSRMLRLDVGN